jgi:hypothetical protein
LTATRRIASAITLLAIEQVERAEKADEPGAVSDAATDPWRDEPDSVGGVGG